MSAELQIIDLKVGEGKEAVKVPDYHPLYRVVGRWNQV